MYRDAAAAIGAPNADTSPQEAKHQTELRLAMYGTVDRWPALSLLPTQFPRCECGCPRLTHRLAGSQRAGCAAGHGCEEFRAPVESVSRRRKM